MVSELKTFMIKREEETKLKQQQILYTIVNNNIINILSKTDIPLSMNEIINLFVDEYNDADVYNCIEKLLKNKILNFIIIQLEGNKNEYKYFLQDKFEDSDLDSKSDISNIPEDAHSYLDDLD